MVNADTLTLVRRELQRLVRNLARGPGRTFIVPAVPDDPPPPRGHCHTLPEIFIQTGGFTDFILPWTRFRLRAGRTCVIPAYVPHEERFHHDKTAFHYLVGMAGHDGISWHQGLLDGKNGFHSRHLVSCRLGDMHRLLRLLDETAACGSRSGRYGPLQLRGSALLAFAAILEAIDTLEPGSVVEHPKIAFCKRYIYNHLSESTLCVKTLAGLAECSPNYLSSLFRAHTGERITRFLNARRLERAGDLLVRTTLNISEIARACGYADPAYMTRRFTRFFHMTPRAYRARHAAARRVPEKR